MFNGIEKKCIFALSLLGNRCYEQKRVGGDTYITRCILWCFILWLAKLSRKQKVSLRNKAAGTATHIFCYVCTDN